MDVTMEVNKHSESSNDYLGLVNKLVLPQTATLDGLIDEIVAMVKQPDYLIEIEKIQIYYLKLSTELYMMVDKLKQFEIYSSLSKANAAEAYNNAYLKEATSSEKKPAVAELQIKAELNAQKESLVNNIYASAFKTIKNKVDAGNNVADTLKNIIKVRTNLEFTSSQTTQSSNTF